MAQTLNIQSALVHLLQCTDDSDYVPLTSQLITIPAESTISQDFCATFSVLGDNIREDDETVSINVQVQDTTDIFEGQTSVTITILDDGDGELLLVHCL